MLKLKKILRLLLVVASCSACGKLPSRPEIVSKLVSMDHNMIFNVNNQTGEEYEEILVFHNNNKPVVNDSLDLNTCHSNEDWGKILTYIRLLERYSPRKMRRELYKMRESSRKLQERNGI